MTTRARPPFEFSAEQERVIGTLADRVRGTAGIAFILAALFFASSLLALTSAMVRLGIASFVIAAYLAWSAIKTRSSAEELQAIVDTKGKDIDHLMAALSPLISLYRAKLLLALAFLVAIIVLALPTPAG